MKKAVSDSCTETACCYQFPKATNFFSFVINEERASDPLARARNDGRFAKKQGLLIVHQQP
jgi:hypothetical protein